MALQLVLGGSGSGKSHYLYEETLKQAQKNPKRRYYFLVPEQFTMAVQREFVVRSRGHAILNIDVLSFKRLAFRVFEELGEDHTQILEDTGKNLMLRRLVGELAPKLSVLSGNLHRAGYIDEIKSFITELTQYRISPDMLREMAAQGTNSPMTQAKLKDISLLYESFLDYLSGDYLLAEEVTEYLAGIVGKSRLFDDAVLIFDGFTGFTPVQQSFLQAVLPMVTQSIFAVTIDEREDFYGSCELENLFYLSKKTIQTLLKLAQDAGIEIDDAVIMRDGAKKRFVKAPKLAHLEANLFRLGMNKYVGKASDEITIRSFARPKDELVFAAQEIRRLVRTEGYRYRDFAIVTGDVSGFSHYVDPVFTEYELPYFIDQTDPIVYHPLIEYVRSLLQLSVNGALFEPMMRVLKTGLLPIPIGQVDLLENYLIAYGIQGEAAWKHTWVRNPEWLSAEQLDELNVLRTQLMELFEPVFVVMADDKTTVRERTGALYEMLSLVTIEDDASIRIQRALVELFDKLVGLLGEEVLPPEEYQEILEAGFDAAEVAIIPPGFDQVLVGDIERTRLGDIRVLFFIGVNDGIIPKSQNDGGILSQLERQTLANAQYELAPTARERAFIQRFYLYLNLTKPKDRLYLSFARTGSDGTALRRSYLIGMLNRIFPDLSVIDETDSDALRMLERPKAAFSYLAAGMETAKAGKASETWRALLAWYMKHETWSDSLEQLMHASFFRFEQETLPRDVSRLLYGSVLETSVTRLERFAACAYAHFMSYGLRLMPREQNDFEQMDFGNLIHTALENYAVELAKSAYTWFDVPQDESKRLGDEALRRALEQSRNDALFTSAKNRYLTTRIKRLLGQTIDTLTAQVRKGRFVPSNYELGFGFADSLSAMEFSLSEEEKMRLRGRIDRVDVLHTDGETYVKIIDYKSGKTQFSLLNLYHGLQLQLVVYLNAAMEHIRKSEDCTNVTPAGIFYYHIDEPIVEADAQMSEEEIWQSIFEKLRLDGIVNNEPEVYEAMDESLTDKSDVIPIARNKDGSLSKKSKAYTKEQFQDISNYVNTVIKELGKRMINGEISIEPYELKDANACSYCNYKSVCGFDKQLSGCGYKKLEQFQDEKELLDKIHEKLEEKSDGKE